MSDQQTSGLINSISGLIPSCTVEHRTISRKIFEQRYPWNVNSNSRCGVANDGHSYGLWFFQSNDTVVILDVEREGIPLSALEKQVLKHFPKAMTALLVSGQNRRSRIAERIASRYSFEHILISGYLRKLVNAATLWTASLIIGELQELAFRRYEGQPASSGFVFTSQPAAYVKRISKEYEYDRFVEPIHLYEGFFRYPASFRYVDGRNAFYLIDNFQRIHGVLRSSDPLQYSRLDRSSHKHIVPLLPQNCGRAWAAYIGANDDVNLALSNDRHIRWSRFHWHVIDRGHIRNYLESIQLSADLRDDIVATVFAISDLRLGMALLIPDRDDHLPTTCGRIDESDIGGELSRAIQGRNFERLCRNGAIVGILTSDGLTVISKSGRVIDSGVIIDITKNKMNSGVGGGRTQASMAASKFGLVIKVSEDGPISLFRDGKEIIQYAT